VADQVDRFGRGLRALQRRRAGDPADLEHAERGADLHHPEMALRFVVGAIDHGERADVGALHHGVEQRVVFGAVLRRKGRQPGPHVIGAEDRRRDLGAVARNVERLEPAVAPFQHLALRKRWRRPVGEVVHASRAALSLVKKPLSSPLLAASLKPANEPCSISFAMRMKPPQAERASAPPTLMRRTPMLARSLTVWPNAAPLRKFTGFGATALTTASICSRVLMPGA